MFGTEKYKMYSVWIKNDPEWITVAWIIYQAGRLEDWKTHKKTELLTSNRIIHIDYFAFLFISGIFYEILSKTHPHAVRV